MEWILVAASLDKKYEVVFVVFADGCDGLIAKRDLILLATLRLV